MGHQRRGRRLCEMVRQGLEVLGDDADVDSLSTWITQNWPRARGDIATAAIYSCTVNCSWRTEFRRNSEPRVARQPRDCLYENVDGRLELFDPEKHGDWLIAEQADGELFVCVASNPFAKRTIADPNQGDHEQASSDDHQLSVLRWLAMLPHHFVNWLRERAADHMLVCLGALACSPVALLIILVYGGLAVPVGLLAERIPGTWRAFVGYAAASWCVAATLGVTIRYLWVTWKWDSREEFVGKTAWVGFRQFLVYFFWVCFVFGSVYWMLDRLMPALHFNLSGASLVDWLYFSLMTVATVGYGDISPSSWFTRALASVQVLQGLCLLGMFIGVLVSMRAGELARGYPAVWRSFARWRDEMLELSSRYGRNSPEEWAGHLNGAIGICSALSQNEEFGHAFLRWLSSDSHAKLGLYAVNQRGRIMPLNMPAGPMAEIIREFGSAEGDWQGLRAGGKYEVSKGGSIQLYRRCGTCVWRSALTSSAPRFVADDGADEHILPPGYAPIGADRNPFDTAKPVWQRADLLTPLGFMKKILGYVDRYFVEIGQSRDTILFTS